MPIHVNHAVEGEYEITLKISWHFIKVKSQTAQTLQSFCLSTPMANKVDAVVVNEIFHPNFMAS